MCSLENFGEIGFLEWILEMEDWDWFGCWRESEPFVN